jgi:hypothetical protein
MGVERIYCMGVAEREKGILIERYIIQLSVDQSSCGREACYTLHLLDDRFRLYDL